MPTSRKRLNAADRTFFGLVGRAVTTNPFTDEYSEIVAKIGGRPAAQARLADAVAVVAERVAKLDAQGGADLARYGPEDAEILSFALLFDVYYAAREAFDELVAAQLEAGNQPCPVPFAADTLALLERRGFERDSALRHFAMFFQIRRAFYLIDRALIGRSPCMRALRHDLWNNIFTRDIRWYADYLWDRMEDFSTLLLGETGTGKGSAAAAIGRSGFIPFDPKTGRFVESFTRAFVSLNLSQHPEPLIESELFGHKKGAFTGAVESHEGVFAACSPYGSIFLDEIGDLSVPIQIKLLQVLQERTFTPVGGRDELRFRGRVVAATNRSVDELRERGTFRDDFFYRLCSDVIVVPPLRQRLLEAPGELEELVGHTILRMLGEDAPRMTTMVCKTITEQLGPGYAWSGNVRELEQCVRRILLKGSYEGDRVARRGAPAELVSGIEEGSLDARELLASYCALLYRRHGSYEQVARITRLDRRTVKKHVEQAQTASSSSSSQPSCHSSP